MKRFLIPFLTTLLFASLSALTLGQESREVQKSLPLKKDGRLVIDTYKGSITVTTWDKAEVEVYAKIESDETFFDRGDENVQDTEIRIDGRENEVRIKTDYEKLHRHRTGFWGIFGDDSNISLPLVNYTIKMPRTAQLKIKDYKSRTKISDLKADLDLNTYKGEVDVQNLEGAMDFETYKGEAEIDFSKFTGNSRFETYKGSIRISLPKNAGFVLDTDISSRVDFSSDFKIEMRSYGRKRREMEYHGTINGGGPSLQLKSSKGTLTLRES